MSENLVPNQSYEDLVKQLKPFSIVVHKISAEEFVKLKVVDDPNKIRDEVIDLTIDDVIDLTIDDEEDPEEEIEVDLTEVEAKVTEIVENEVSSKTYSCFFCKRTMNGYIEAFTHFQLHIDYFPIQCSDCDEANIDVISFVRHCRKSHPELQKAKYIHKYNRNCFEWIHSLLTTDSHLVDDSPQRYCPACEWIGTPDVNNPNDSTQTPKPLSVLKHIHEHIRYKPFNCVKCEQNGKDFRIHVLNSTPKNHFLSEHKELSDDPPFWRFFNKKYTIPSLDKFIANYLTIFGMKIAKKRFKKSKKNQMNAIKASLGLIDSKIDNKPIKIQPKCRPIAPQVIPEITLQNLMSVTQTPAQTYISGNKIFIIASNQINTQMKSTNEMENPLLLYPSNNKINMSAIPVESTDIGIVCVDPKMIEIDDKLFKYICVFCEDQQFFYSKIEACLHYAIHFNYNPVVCMLCEKKFLDLSLLVDHYYKEHQKYENNLFHYFKENEKIEKWINRFLDHQKTYLFMGNVSAVFGDYCFVCNKHEVYKHENRYELKCETNAIRDHINQHLQYFPYKCSICLHGGREVMFTSLHSKTIEEHLYRIHGIKSMANEEVKHFHQLFVKTDELLDLEKFIDSRISNKRKKLSENCLVLNLKRKLEDIDIECRKRMESNQLSTAIVLPTIHSTSVTLTSRNEINPRTYGRPHVSTGSATNFYPKISIISSTNSSPIKLNGINSNQFIPKANVRPTVMAAKPTDFIPNHKTYIEPFLLCFHCHQKVLNTSELETHHKASHPMLTIASYAPTKRDLQTIK